LNARIVILFSQVAQIIGLFAHGDEPQPSFLCSQADANTRVRPAIADRLGHASVIARKVRGPWAIPKQVTWLPDAGAAENKSSTLQPSTEAIAKAAVTAGTIVPVSIALIPERDTPERRANSSCVHPRAVRRCLIPVLILEWAAIILTYI
jgi:hypothetical protein